MIMNITIQPCQASSPNLKFFKKKIQKHIFKLPH